MGEFSFDPPPAGLIRIQRKQYEQEIAEAKRQVTAQLVLGLRHEDQGVDSQTLERRLRRRKISWPAIHFAVSDLKGEEKLVEEPRSGKNSIVQMTSKLLLGPTARTIFANDPRDKWLYQKCSKRKRGKLLTFSAIASELKKIGSNKGWSIITDPTAIKNAANRWAVRNDKPPISMRQQGKPGKAK